MEMFASYGHINPCPAECLKFNYWINKASIKNYFNKIK